MTQDQANTIPHNLYEKYRLFLHSGKTVEGIFIIRHGYCLIQNDQLKDTRVNLNSIKSWEIINKNVKIKKGHFLGPATVIAI